MSERFDEAAKTWDNKPGRLEMASKFADEIKKRLDPKKHFMAMEYGCGTANVSFMLKDNFKEITLADSSSGMLEEVEKKTGISGGNNLKPVLMDLEKEPVNSKFDVIYTLMALHHVVEVETVVSRLGHMLNPQGMLIIGDLDKEDGNFHAYPENQEVHFGFEKQYLEKILVENNLAIQDYAIFHELERDHTGAIKVYPLFILVAVLDF